jgi:predicted nuclease of predicted toxin-antitoxin system
LRFIVDAQLPPRLALWLSARGHEASHVRDLDLADQPDTAILAKARELGAAIITKDADFMHLARATGPCKIVWIRFGNATSGDLLLCLEPIWAEIEDALANGQQLVEVSR